MSHRGVVNTVVALVAILVTGGLAVRAVVSQPGAEDSPSLSAAGIGGRHAVAVESPAATAAPLTTAPTVIRETPATTATTAAAPRPAVTAADTVPPPPETTAPAVTVAPVVATVAPPAASGVGCIPICWERRPPPAVAPSWTVTEGGVTLAARIEPAAPQVGDTVTIFFTSNADADFCCLTTVTGRGAVLYQSPQVTGASCPPPTMTSGSTTVVMDMPTNYSFSVATTTHYLCEGPPNLLPPGGSARLEGSFWVNPLP